jgi:hypothetical protein
LGTIDHAVDPHGRVVTNFTRIQAGSLLRASGGYVLLNLEDALTEPFVWKTLKRALQSNQIKIEAYDPFAFFTISALQPEAIPIHTKVVVMGHAWLYYLLYFNDPDFPHMFKIKADFGDEMARTAAHEASYAHFIARLCREEDLRHFDRSGVEAVLEHGMRRVAHQDKLASQLGPVADLVREASYMAAQAEAPVARRPTCATSCCGLRWSRPCERGSFTSIPLPMWIKGWSYSPGYRRGPWRRQTPSTPWCRRACSDWPRICWPLLTIGRMAPASNIEEATMIDETLAQLQAKIRQASALNTAQQAELLQLLQALDTEIHALAHTHTEQAESIARFTGVSTHEAVRQHRNPHLVEVALQGLVSSVEAFETSHPQLVRIVNAISTFLANLGI